MNILAGLFGPLPPGTRKLARESVSNDDPRYFKNWSPFKLVTRDNYLEVHAWIKRGPAVYEWACVCTSEVTGWRIPEDVMALLLASLPADCTLPDQLQALKRLLQEPLAVYAGQSGSMPDRFLNYIGWLVGPCHEQWKKDAFHALQAAGYSMFFR